eukprot:6083095-Amphidinium_carterae.1
MWLLLVRRHVCEEEDWHKREFWVTKDGSLAYQSDKDDALASFHVRPWPLKLVPEHLRPCVFIRCTVSFWPLRCHRHSPDPAQNDICELCMSHTAGRRVTVHPRTRHEKDQRRRQRMAWKQNMAV